MAGRAVRWGRTMLDKLREADVVRRLLGGLGVVRVLEELLLAVALVEQLHHLLQVDRPVIVNVKHLSPTRHASDGMPRRNDAGNVSVCDAQHTVPT